MKMKNIVRDFMIAGLIIAATASVAMAAQPSDGNICLLVNELKGVFRTLRTLAFVGAAFMMAAWAWEFISKGDAKMDDLKKKGIALIVGFAMLFAVGIMLQLVLTGNIPGMNCIIEPW
ncbi:MAG: hypothetical protein FWG80_04710 [Alphaproteobacteria bacterium]|nr:hypothetical protein [Alphaproteobacteria bacterium]